MIHLRRLCPAIAAALAITLCALVASADDSGALPDAGVDDADADADASGQSDTTPLACDGALWDTTVGSLCDVSHVEPAAVPPGALLATAAAAFVVLFRRRRRPRARGMPVAFSASKKESLR